MGPVQGEGDGEVADRVGGQQQGAMARVQLVDTRGAREVVEGPLAIAGHVGKKKLPSNRSIRKSLHPWGVRPGRGGTSWPVPSTGSPWSCESTRSDWRVPKSQEGTCRPLRVSAFQRGESDVRHAGPSF